MAENTGIKMEKPGLAFPNSITMAGPEGANADATIILHADGRIEGDAESLKRWMATADLGNFGVTLVLVWLLSKELERQDGSGEAA